MPPLGGNIPGGRRAQFFPGMAPPETALKNYTPRMTSEDGLHHPGGRNGQAKTLWPEKLLEVEDTENGSPL